MRPNRVAARFISGGRHQTFGAILGSPWKLHTVTSSANRREQYRALQRRERQAALVERRRAARESAAARKREAAAKKAVPRPPRARKPNPVLVVNPRDGKPITYAQAVKALREAQERAERLAAGLPGDPPAKKTRTAAAAKQPAKATAARPAAPRTPRKTSAAPPRPRQESRTRGRRVGPAPDPAAAPGKDLRGLYYVLTCPCQGTGRIATLTGDGRIIGSTSCPRHGRAARGSRKVFSRRAMTNGGLPGLAGWLSRRSGDKSQRRAHRQAGRRRYAGPTEACSTCDEGIVNRELTLTLRAQYAERVQADRLAAGRRALGERKLEALARRAWPFDRCRDCKGLGRVPSERAGDWLRRTDLPQQHRLTARERATGKRKRL